MRHPSIDNFPLCNQQKTAGITAPLISSSVLMTTTSDDLTGFPLLHAVEQDTLPSSVWTNKTK